MKPGTALGEGLAMATTLYGIKSCDTVKKARAWLEAHGVAHTFVDYKSKGVEPERLEAWVRAVGWQVLLNRNGITFRGLPAAQKEGIDEKKAFALMSEKPSIIKRPVLELEERVVVGFKPEAYADLFGK